MILYDFTCDKCEKTHNELVQSWRVRTIPCPDCGDNMRRELCAPIMDPKLGIYPDAFPSTGRQWAKRHEHHARMEKRQEREHGTYNTWPGSDTQG